MGVTPEIITALFQGSVVLLGALAAFGASRSRRVAIRTREFRSTQRRLLIALAHIFTLEESGWADRGLTPPPRPRGLDDDDDEGPAAPPAPAPLAGPTSG